MNSEDTLEVETLPALTNWAAHTENALTPSSAAGSPSATIVLASVLFSLHAANPSRKCTGNLLEIISQLFVIVFLCTYFT